MFKKTIGASVQCDSPVSL